MQFTQLIKCCVEKCNKPATWFYHAPTNRAEVDMNYCEEHIPKEAIKRKD